MHFLTIDVEDWYHILDLKATPDVNSWSKLDSRVEKNFMLLLDELDKYNAKANCFFLGWIADNYPHLVREAFKRGHEISSHGYSHQLVYTQLKEVFYNDIITTRKVLEDTIGFPVFGYRAPGFSITNTNLWAFEEIVKAGYTYDSSIFPANRAHGGLVGSSIHPHIIHTGSGNLIELPISVFTFFKQRVCFSGGGYLRLFPYFFIIKMVKQYEKLHAPVVFYIHPREIDLHQPKLKMSFSRSFKSYYNLASTLPKLRKILQNHQLWLINRWININYSQLKTFTTEELLSPEKRQNHQYRSAL